MTVHARRRALTRQPSHERRPSHAWRPSHERRPGFTLIEVVVVLLIVAVATAFAVPAMLAPREDDDMTAAARRIESLFRLARDSAVRGGVPIAVAVDSATGAAWLVPERAEAWPEDALLHQQGYSAWSARLTPPGTLATRRADQDAAGESLELPNTVRLELSAARARFLFMPSGSAFGDTLVLRAATRALTITVDPWTGDALAH